MTLRIGLAEIADRLHVGFDDLKELLVDESVELRHEQDELPAERRWKLDPTELERLYVDKDWTVSAIAAHLGVNRGLIYRALHRHHLPVAAGGGGDKRVRFDELVADRRVQRALASAGVPLAGTDPPIRTRPLPDKLLHRLLDELHLSTFDVELLTGRLARSVRNDAAAARAQA